MAQYIIQDITGYLNENITKKLVIETYDDEDKVLCSIISTMQIGECDPIVDEFNVQDVEDARLIAETLLRIANNTIQVG